MGMPPEIAFGAAAEAHVHQTSPLVPRLRLPLLVPLVQPDSLVSRSLALSFACVTDRVDRRFCCVACDDLNLECPLRAGPLGAFECEASENRPEVR